MDVTLQINAPIIRTNLTIFENLLSFISVNFVVHPAFHFSLSTDSFAAAFALSAPFFAACDPGFGTDDIPTLNPLKYRTWLTACAKVRYTPRVYLT